MTVGEAATAGFSAVGKALGGLAMLVVSAVTMILVIGFWLLSTLLPLLLMLAALVWLLQQLGVFL